MMKLIFLAVFSLLGVWIFLMVDDYIKNMPEPYIIEGVVLGTVVVSSGFSSSTDCIIEFNGTRTTADQIGSCYYLEGDRVKLRVSGNYIRIMELLE